MDHLPYPSNSPLPRMKVPLLVTDIDVEDSALGGLESSALRHGWAAESVDLTWLQEGTTEEKARIVQKWLYFGLLCTFLGDKINLQDFVLRSDLVKRSYLNTSSLPRYLQRSQLNKVEIPAYEAILRNVDRHLDSFDEHLIRHCIHEADCKNAQKVVFSVRILTDSLRRAIRNRPEFAETNRLTGHPDYQNPFHPPGTTCYILRRRLRNQDGWCTMVIAHILSRYSSSAAYFLSSLPRQKPRLGNHDLCTAFECKLTLANDSYKPRHVCEDGECSMPPAPLQEVMKVI